MFREAFEKFKNRQVASVIHYKVFPKSKMAGQLYTATDLIDAFNQAAEAKPLIHRRVWFKIDSCSLDKALAEKVSKTLIDHDEAMRLYASLEKNPSPKFLQKMHEEQPQDDLEEILNENISPIIKLDFNDSSLNEVLINTAIPFERLRSDLVRMNKALDNSGRASLEDVTVVHTPLYSKSLSKDQYDALFKPN